MAELRISRNGCRESGVSWGGVASGMARGVMDARAPRWLAYALLLEGDKADGRGECTQCIGVKAIVQYYCVHKDE